jgi:hypothetical protein
MPILDGMIAATPLEHDPTVVTRNIRDFKRREAEWRGVVSGLSAGCLSGGGANARW